MNSVAVVLSMMAMMMLIDDDKDDGDAFLAILCYMITLTLHSSVKLTFAMQ